MQLITSIINMQKQASKDQMRYSLTGVCLDIVNDKLRMRATDGHALAIVYLDIPEGLKLNHPYIIQPDSVKMLKLLYAGNKKCVWVIKMHDNGKIELCVGLTGVILERIVGDYPDTSRVMPTNVNHKISFNPFLLAQLCESMRDNKLSDQCILEIDTTSKLSPMSVSFNGNNGVLMPMRASK